MNEKLPSKSAQGSPKMQQIERYGVIALVFLLVTIVAVSFWGDSKSPGFWSRLTGKTDAKKDVAQIPLTPPDLVVDHVTNPNLPITPVTTIPEVTPDPTPALVNGNTQTVNDTVLNGNGTIGGTTNTFVPPVVNEVVYAPPMPQPVPTPVAKSGGEYTIQKGDSLALIARRQLGSEGRWTEIQAANPGLDPKRLAVGKTIRMPGGGAAMSVKSNSVVKSASAKPAVKSESKPVASSRSYTIKKGDVLSSIARAQLGDERRWKDILAVNPGLDPAKLAIGTAIKLPGGAALAPKRSTSTNSDSRTAVATAIDKPRVK